MHQVSWSDTQLWYKLFFLFTAEEPSQGAKTAVSKCPLYVIITLLTIQTMHHLTHIIHKGIRTLKIGVGNIGETIKSS